MINHFVVLIKLNTSPPTPENSLTEDAVGTFSIFYACKVAKLVSKKGRMMTNTDYKVLIKAICHVSCCF